MKIAIASQDKQTITGHTGHCRKFWIYETAAHDIVSKTLLELPKEQSFHASSPHQPHPLDAVQVLIAAGMGQGLVRRLHNHGIEGVVTLEPDPDAAVAGYLNGSLVRASAEHSHHAHAEGDDPAHHHHHHRHHHHDDHPHECHCH